MMAYAARLAMLSGPDFQDEMTKMNYQLLNLETGGE